MDMDIDEIKALIELFEQSTLTELVLERGETRLILKREWGSPLPESDRPQGAPGVPVETTLEGEPAEEIANGYVVRSPIVGTFYRRPSPDEDPYVEVGDRVDAGDTICIVEAMKVMNEVRTERAGIVRAILVEDAAPVEFGQPLIAIEPFE
jgi:acetyl-CoA carboxylase biotin carboxyl carrier protein